MRMLLVEDDRMIGEGIEQVLEDGTYTVDWVRNGAHALTTRQARHDDLVLLDLGLPGTDSLEVLRPIRAQENPVPLLIVTARDELEDRLYGWNEKVESNAMEFLTHSLRKKLGKEAIHNVKGMGWMVSK